MPYSTPDMRTFHLRIALRKAAVMQFHVLATSGPVTTLLRHVLGAEGFFLVSLHSYSKSEESDKVFHSQRMLSASVAADPFEETEVQWDGLSRAHLSRQVVRGCESIARFSEANDWICLCCGQDRC